MAKALEHSSSLPDWVSAGGEPRGELKCCIYGLNVALNSRYIECVSLTENIRGLLETARRRIERTPQRTV